MADSVSVTDKGTEKKSPNVDCEYLTETMFDAAMISLTKSGNYKNTDSDEDGQGGDSQRQKNVSSEELIITTGDATSLLENVNTDLQGNDLNTSISSPELMETVEQVEEVAQEGSDAEMSDHELQIVEDVEENQTHTKDASKDIQGANVTSGGENSSVETLRPGKSDNLVVKTSKIDDDRENLLLAPKDYINCVWSEEPTRLDCANNVTKLSGLSSSKCQVSDPPSKLRQFIKLDELIKQAPTLKGMLSFTVGQDGIPITNGSGNNKAQASTKELPPTPSFRIVYQSEEGKKEQVFKSLGKPSCNVKLHSRTILLRSSESDACHVDGALQVPKQFSTLKVFQPLGTSDVSMAKELPKNKEQAKLSKETDVCNMYKEMLMTRILPIYSPKNLDTRFFSGNFHKCEACDDRFVLQSSLFEHLSRRSAQFNYKCPTCRAGVVFDNRCSLIQHVLDHGASQDSIRLEDLDVSPLPQGAALRHIASGSKEKEDITTLRNVAAESMEKEDATPLRPIASGKTEKKCPVCFQLVTSLKCHMGGKDMTSMKSPNKFDKALLCAECEQILPSQCALKAHARLHKKTAPYICPECGVSFITYSLLWKHMDEVCFHNSKKTSFQCSNCNLIYFSSSSLQNHVMKKHIKEIFKCNLCSAAFFNVDSLRSHRGEKHGSCDMDMSQLQFLKQHKYFSCQICPGQLVHGQFAAQHADAHASDTKYITTVFKCRKCKCIFPSHDLMHYHKKECRFAKDDKDLIKQRKQCQKNKETQPLLSDNIPARDSESFLNEMQNSTLRQTPQEQSSTVHVKDLRQMQEQARVEEDYQDHPAEQQPLNAEALSSSSDDAAREKFTFTENYICKICKKVISLATDRAAVKEHFVKHHQSVFLQALVNGRTTSSGSPGNPSKVVYRFPVQKKLFVENNGTKQTLSSLSRKRKLSPKTVQQLDSKLLPKKTVNVSPKMSKKSPSKTQLQREEHQPASGRIDNSDKYVCYKCSFMSANTDLFKQHIITHRTNTTDLQCPLCGMCFIVRPPLEKHLLIQHSVRDVKECMMKYGLEDLNREKEQRGGKDNDSHTELQENQCKVCREIFDSTLLLEKHFRVHGGAFLLASLKAKKS